MFYQSWYPAVFDKDSLDVNSYDVRLEKSQLVYLRSKSAKPFSKIDSITKLPGSFYTTGKIIYESSLSSERNTNNYYSLYEYIIISTLIKL